MKKLFLMAAMLLMFSAVKAEEREDRNNEVTCVRQVIACEYSRVEALVCGKTALEVIEIAVLLEDLACAE